MDSSVLEIIKLILQVLGTVGTGAVVGGIVTRKLTRAEKKKEEVVEREKHLAQQAEQLKLREQTELREMLDLFNTALKILLRGEVYRIGGEVEQQGFFTLRQKIDFDDAFGIYTQFKGNHQTEEYYAYVCKRYEVKHLVPKEDNDGSSVN